MKITVQSGIDATAFQQLMYQTIQAGAECDARAARLKHEALVRLQPVEKRQGSLFEEGN